MQNRWNYEKKNDQQDSIDRPEVFVIQIFIYVSIPLIICATKKPVNDREDEVSDKVQQNVQWMQETDWDGTQARVNHHEDGIECVLCNIIGINWVIIMQHAPVPRGYDQACSCSNDMDKPKELVVTLQGVFLAGFVMFVIDCAVVARFHFDIHCLFICN